MRTFVTLSAALWMAALGPVRADIPRKQDIPRYIKQLETASSPVVRANAAEAIGHRGAIRKSDVKEAVEPLLNALKNDKDFRVRQAAAAALGSIQPDNNAAVKPLIEALKDPSLKVRAAAATALGSMGPDAREAVPALQEVRKETQDVKMMKKDKKKKMSKKEQMEFQEKRQLNRAANEALRSIGGRRKM